MQNANLPMKQVLQYCYAIVQHLTLELLPQSPELTLSWFGFIELEFHYSWVLLHSYNMTSGSLIVIMLYKYYLAIS